MRFGRHDRSSEPFAIGVERGTDGFAAAWCLDLPGCCALVPPGGDVEERVSLAILEFTAWAHQRSAERLAIEPSQLKVVQSLNTGADVRRGLSTAFFVHDGEPARPNEFPAWANPHDRAVDELRDLVLSLPPTLQGHELPAEGRSPLQVAQHAVAGERRLATELNPSSALPKLSENDPLTRQLQEAHTWLQQIVCDVPADFRRPRASANAEEWSVRKVMRRSIWHLRYHTWEIRRGISGLWIG